MTFFIRQVQESQVWALLGSPLHLPKPTNSAQRPYSTRSWLPPSHAGTHVGPGSLPTRILTSGEMELRATSLPISDPISRSSQAYDEIRRCNIFSNHEIYKNNEENSSHQVPVELGICSTANPVWQKKRAQEKRMEKAPSPMKQHRPMTLTDLHEHCACPFPIHYNFLPTLVSFLQGIFLLIRRRQQQKVKRYFPFQVINKERPH